ncbi:MAG: ABC transporter permease [Candidatus Bathyarchaeia archaeon]|nr:ABC transporter permease [Candidatus Bathyarchaeota archaeon]
MEKLKWILIDGLIHLKRGIPGRLRRDPGPLLVLPSMISVGFLAIGLAYLTSYSLFRFHPSKLIIYELTLENYSKILCNPSYLRVFARTIWISLSASTAAVTLGFFYAYLTVKVESPLARKLLLISLFIPFFSGDVIRVYGWLIIFGKNGLVSRLTQSLMGRSVDLIYTETAVLIGLTQVMIPVAVLMTAPALTFVKRELEYAAQNLGADELKTLRYVVLPLCRPGLIAAFLTTLTLSMTAYAEPDILGGGKTNFVANLMYTFMFNAADYPTSAALGVLLTSMISAVVFMFLKWSGLGTLMYTRRG